MIWISLDSVSSSPADLPRVGMNFRATTCRRREPVMRAEGGAHSLASACSIPRPRSLLDDCCTACLLAAPGPASVNLPERAFSDQLQYVVRLHVLQLQLRVSANLRSKPIPAQILNLNVALGAGVRGNHD